MDPVAYARFLGLDAIVRGQDGVIRRDQALAAGLRSTRIDDLVRRGKWARILPRVYAVGVSPESPRVRVRATWLWAGDTSAVAGPAAAWWLGLNSDPPQSITVVIPPPARRSERAGVQIIRGALHQRDTEFEDWIRVTVIPRTCLDLARRGLPDQLETALRLRRTDLPRLRQSLDRGRGRRGQVQARRAVGDVAANPWGFSERVAHRRLREAGITGWTANPAVRLRGGIRHPDIAIEEIKLAIEIDGRKYHSDPVDFERDRLRHNEFVEAGWTVLQFTWKQLIETPDDFISTVKITMARLRGQL